MKVVINNCFGGFNLSNEAIERCIELGMRCTTYKGGNYEDPTADFVRPDKKDSLMGMRYHIVSKYDCTNDYSGEKAFRSNPIVIQVVEELGAKANGPCAKLKIVEIPFSGIHGWQIDEYDGSESIHEDHHTWG